MTDMPEIPRDLVEACAKAIDVKSPNAMKAIDSLIRAMLELVTLEWVKHPAAEVWRCSTPVGAYKVFSVSQPVTWDFDGFDQIGKHVCITKTAASIEAAKSAALAHYRAAWLAAVKQ